MDKRDELLREVLEWADMMGGWEAPIWDRIREHLGPPMEIHQMWTLSTSHLTEADSDLLADGKHAVPTYNIEFGWLLYVGLDTATDVKSADVGMSADYWRIVRVAREKGCNYIRFDCDGPVEGWLPEHDW